jgi:hypothetical protein
MRAAGGRGWWLARRAAGESMKEKEKQLFEQVFHLLTEINAIEPEGVDERPSTPLLGAMLETISNKWLIKLLRVVRDDVSARHASLALSKRSSLFDKLIIMKGKSGWVLRLHTYNVLPLDRTGQRQSNLGELLDDDEENTHVHRWRLSSRFITGGFNNITWDIENVDGSELDPGTPVGEGQVLNRYLLPPTEKTGGQDSREATLKGKSVVTERRSEFYQAGDVITYPIVDPHSVGTLAPLTGTTMTLAHTGRGLREDSSFYAMVNGGSVKQYPYSEKELIAAIEIAITRLQLIELGHSLSHDRAFRHLNSVETELLPRLAELMVIVTTHPEPSEELAYAEALKLGFTPAHAKQIMKMNPGAVAKLIVDSQRLLYTQQFVKDARPLLQQPQLPQSIKDPPPFRVPDTAQRALKTRLVGTPPENLIGPRQK